MKSGPCRDSFIEWEECVEQAEKDKEDMVEKCHKVTFLLKECMEKYSDYYEPVLQAERAMNDEAEAEAAASVAVSDQDSEERESTFENPSSSEDVGQLAERVDSVLLSSEGPPSE
ncbi:hypothetical protein KP509_35G054700 [Ceratopteris richardii]|nr:hypothetical protein KP509_35G054700 [Ceratopteris richardii]